jgi:agmatinase
VEVNPQLDVGTGTTSYLAAHTVIEFLGLLCSQPRWVERRTERAKQRIARS